MQSLGPFDPLTPRQELISELESCGFDEFAAKDWRETYSDDELRDAVNRINNAEAN